MSAWSRFWQKWNSCGSCIRARGMIGAALQLLGSMLISFATMYAIQAAAGSAALEHAYRGGPCGDCPAGASLETVQVQDRQGSVLFVLGGTLPSTAAGLPADVRLEANDVDILLRPDGDGFRILSATKAGVALAPDALAAGITDGYLAIDVRDSALRAPVTFVVGLWKDGAYRGRIPREASLTWAGTGALRLAVAATSAPLAAASATAPASSPMPASTLSATPAGPDVTALAAGCTSFAAQLPPFPRPMSVTTGSGPDPRTNVATSFISTAFAAPAPTEPLARAPFSATVVLARSGQPTGIGTRAIDRTGWLQLWAYWDGAAMHKGIRTWDGSSWQMLTSGAAEPLTVALRTQSLAFYWPGLRSGDQYGAIVAAAAGCRSIGTDLQGRPQQRAP